MVTRWTRLLAVLFLSALALCPAGATLARPRPADATATTIYAGVSGAGVFKSTDATGSWVGLATLPTSPRALAGGDPAHWRDVYAALRGGVYVSHNGGNSWTQALRGQAVCAVLVQSPTVTLAGTDRGLFSSSDEGVTWSPVAGMTGSVSALARSPQNPAILYAGGQGGAWVSQNGGQSWSSLRQKLPARVTIIGLAVSPADAGTVYAATTGGIWRATGALTATGFWTLLNKNVPVTRFSAVAADATHVFAVSSGAGVLYVSTDGGSTWSVGAVAGLTGGITALAADPQQPGTLVVGDTNGMVRLSTDDGISWTTPSGTVAATVGSPILALAIVHRQPLPVDGVPDPRQPGVQYVARNGGHTLSGPFLAFWQAHQDVTGDPETEVFVDPAHGNLRAQYFENMELLQQGDGVVPAPLGLENLPAGYDGKGTYMIEPRFLDYWSGHGGVAVFGLPVSPAFNQSTGDGTGHSYLVQYFRNARLEYHPEYGLVLVGKLGVQSLQALGWL